MERFHHSIDGYSTASEEHQQCRKKGYSTIEDEHLITGKNVRPRANYSSSKSAFANWLINEQWESGALEYLAHATLATAHRPPYATQLFLVRLPDDGVAGIDHLPRRVGHQRERMAIGPHLLQQRHIVGNPHRVATRFGFGGLQAHHQHGIVQFGARLDGCFFFHQLLWEVQIRQQCHQKHACRNDQDGNTQTGRKRFPQRQIIFVFKIRSLYHRLSRKWTTKIL